MKGTELLRKLRRYARQNGLDLRVETARGKGDHVTVWLGEKRTILGDQKAELKKGTFHGMLKQLGIRPEDLE